MWGIWGGSSVDKNKASTKDRPPLAVYLDQLLSREAANVSVESKENAKNISLSSSFLVVPLDTIGKRVDHNAEICASLISFFEERTRQLQKTLKDMRKKVCVITACINYKSKIYILFWLFICYPCLFLDYFFVFLCCSSPP